VGTAYFDLDGVLIDSALTVRLAYADAGVTAPDDILAHEGSDWLVRAVGGDRARAYAAHDAKNRSYLLRVRTGGAPVLPAFEVAQRLNDEGWYLGLITAAPHGAARALRTYVAEARLAVWPFAVEHENIRTPDKMRVLRTAAAVAHRLNDDEPAACTGVYVDDQDKLISLHPCWSFVHYTRQDAATLYKQITEAPACSCA